MLYLWMVKFKGFMCFKFEDLFQIFIKVFIRQLVGIMMGIRNLSIS